MNAPFFVIGSPRSGTSFLQWILDAHEEVFLTHETRVMTFVSRAMTQLMTDERAVLNHRPAWIDVLRERMPELVEEFYFRLGVKPDMQWGDKNPHYSDGLLDPACLATIDALFPESKFIHIVRDGRAVAASLLSLGWSQDPADAADTWNRHVEHSRAFGSALPANRWLEFTYERLMRGPSVVAGEVFEFLGLSMSSAVEEFLAAEAKKPRPVSVATSDVRSGPRGWAGRLDQEAIRILEWRMADLLVDYGYETDEWRASLQPATPSRRPPPLNARLAEALPGHSEERSGLIQEVATLEQDAQDAAQQAKELELALVVARRALSELRVQGNPLRRAFRALRLGRILEQPMARRSREWLRIHAPGLVDALKKVRNKVDPGIQRSENVE